MTVRRLVLALAALLLLFSYFVYYFSASNYRLFAFFPLLGLVLWGSFAALSIVGLVVLGRLAVTLLPSVEGSGETTGVLTVGGTLLMVTVAVYSLTPPSLSLTLPPTFRVPLSTVGQEAVLEALNPP